MNSIDNDDDDDTQVYKRPWVGLTDEEIDGIEQEIYTQTRMKNQTLSIYLLKFARAIEAKLREKNF